MLILPASVSHPAVGVQKKSGFPIDAVLQQQFMGYSVVVFMGFSDACAISYFPCVYLVGANFANGTVSTSYSGFDQKPAR